MKSETFKLWGNRPLWQRTTRWGQARLQFGWHWLKFTFGFTMTPPVKRSGFIAYLEFGPFHLNFEWDSRPEYCRRVTP